MPDLRRFHFDEMASEVRDKVEPSKSGVDRYVGLEHLDPGSLKIRRWGDPSEVESAKIRFKSGDVIFGKRRAYQRKLAVADFDGICSAHAMVLRPTTTAVDPGFFPFFMESEFFMDRAVKISVGGLSPTINWRDLAREPFLLPSMEEQRRASSCLIEIERNEESLLAVEGKAQCLLESSVTALLRQDVLQSLYSEDLVTTPRGWRVVRFGDVCERITYGFTNPMPTTEKGPWMVTAADVVGGRIDYGSARHTTDRAYNYDLTDKSRVMPGDVLLTKDGTLGRVAVVDRLGVCVNQSVAVLRTGSEILPHFLFWSLTGPAMQWRLLLDAGGSAVRHLYITKVAECRFLLPPIEEQDSIVSQLDRIESAVLAARQRTHAFRALRREVIASALRGTSA